eukprot:5692890-Alexandrium_andersonii.AAC.1
MYWPAEVLIHKCGSSGRARKGSAHASEVIRPDAGSHFEPLGCKERVPAVHGVPDLRGCGERLVGPEEQHP